MKIGDGKRERKEKKRNACRRGLRNREPRAEAPTLHHHPNMIKADQDKSQERNGKQENAQGDGEYARSGQQHERHAHARSATDQEHGRQGRPKQKGQGGHRRKQWQQSQAR
jgi:hypothetical protein